MKLSPEMAVLSNMVALFTSWVALDTIEFMKGCKVLLHIDNTYRTRTAFFSPLPMGHLSPKQAVDDLQICDECLE